MPARYRRSEDALADLIRENRRGTRDAQRATGTEKAQTKLVAEAAIEAADAASETANGKSTVVRSTSPATAAGSYKEGDQWWQFSGANIVGLWLHSGTAWVAQALTNAIIATLDAGKITTGILAADRIGANSITTAKLSSTAIDGMTITGALIRTAASGQRMEFDVDGLKSFSSLGVLTSVLSAFDGKFLLSSVADSSGLELRPEAIWLKGGSSIHGALGKYGLQVYPTPGLSAQYVSDRAFVRKEVTHPISGASVIRTQMGSFSADGGDMSASIDTDSPSVRNASASLATYFNASGVPYSSVFADIGLFSEITKNQNPSDPPGPLSIKSGDGVLIDTELGSGIIKLNSVGTGVEINRASGGSVKVTAGSGVNTASIIMEGASGGKIKLNAAKVEFQGDRPWARLDSTAAGTAIGYLGSGVTHYVDGTYDGLRARIKGGVLYVTGAIQRTGGFPANYVIFTFNTGFRPGAAAVQYAYAGGHNFILASQINGTVVVAVASSNPVMYLGLTIPLD